jgi:penicillin amidase
VRLEDILRVQGYLHARDRFFQMDRRRRAASGTLAELTGDFNDLFVDAEIRLLGLRAAAEREAEILNAREQQLFQAYADGVNAWLASNPLPSEYAELEIGSVPGWEIVDTLLVVKGFVANLTNFSEPRGTALLADFEAAGNAQGFDGRALFEEDVAGISPMDPAATVPDAGGTVPFLASAAPRQEPLSPSIVAAAHRYRDLGQLPASRSTLEGSGGTGGSNVWGVADWRSAGGAPMVASDPHLELTAPSVLYEIHLRVAGDPLFRNLNLSGSSIVGIPMVVAPGQNDHIAWGSTTFLADTVDYFSDRLVRGDPSCPVRLCIDSAGERHPVEEHSETYRFNLVGDGAFDNLMDFTAVIASQAPEAVHVLSVPFRSFGPIVEVDDRSVVDDSGNSPAETTVLTLQWTGLHGLRSARALVGWVSARDVWQLGEALRFFGVPLHWVVADNGGNVAYFASGDLPLRADLEAGQALGGGPRRIRDGSGPSNWIPDPLYAQGQRVPPYSQGQSIPFLVIPAKEMPQIVNPPAGFVVSANNDPVGTQLDNDVLNQFRPSSPGSIYYLGPTRFPGLAAFLGLRAGRITQLLREKIEASEKISLDDMKRFQGDTQLLDAELLVPFLLTAHENARRTGAPAELAALGGDPEIAEAVARVAAWDFSTPTGIPEGYDAADLDGLRDPVVSPEEADHSVAATLYSVWRGQLLDDVTNSRLVELGLPGIFFATALRNVHQLLSQNPFSGVGVSGVDFFPEPAALAAGDRRDVALLQALRDVLDALAGPRFAAAFANSTSQDDYRWGKLHRISFEHRLGGARSIPTAAGFEDLAPQLRGLARDGGFETVNVAGADSVNRDADGFLFSFGAAFRLVAAPGHRRVGPAAVLGFASVPGGSSDDANDPLYASQLERWLTVDYHRVRTNPGEIRHVAAKVEHFAAPRP